MRLTTRLPVRCTFPRDAVFFANSSPEYPGTALQHMNATIIELFFTYRRHHHLYLRVRGEYHVNDFRKMKVIVPERAIVKEPQKGSDLSSDSEASSYRSTRAPFIPRIRDSLQTPSFLDATDAKCSTGYGVTLNQMGC